MRIFLLILVLMGVIARRSAVYAQTPLPFSTASNDYAPSITADGRKMYFTSTRPGGKGGLDVWYAEKYDSTWGDPLNCGGAINDSLEQGMASVTPDGETMVLTICDAPDGYGSCDLYISHRQQDGTWSKPQNMGYSINTPAWESSPSISRDGKTLYFASDRPGGRGGIDIYETKRTALGWSDPVDLSINTPGNDVSPYISLDDSTLYFGSYGINLNSAYCDIYMSVFSDGNWSAPKAVAPVNSDMDDFFPTMSGSQDVMYFCSSRSDKRTGGHGFHIYSAVLPPEFRPAHAYSAVNGKTLDAETGLPLDARITVRDARSGAIAYDGESNALTGAFTFILPRGAAYRVFATIQNYYLAVAKIAVPDTAAEYMPFDVKAEHVQVGKPYVAEGIFRHGTDTLTPAGEFAVSTIAALLRSDQPLHVAVFVNNERIEDDSALHSRRLLRLRAALPSALRDQPNIEWKPQPFEGEALAERNNYLVLVPILN